ncbi:hypothetical protein ACVIN2_003420 [Bradyrhizobium sp. USDA 3650]
MHHLQSFKRHLRGRLKGVAPTRALVGWAKVRSAVPTISREDNAGGHASPRAGADLVERRDGPLLQQPGTDAAEHMVRALPLQNDIVDAVTVQQLPKQQSSRPCPDDCDFCPQYLLLPIL